MIDKWRAFIKNKNNLIIVVLFGVLLMVIALPVDGGSRKRSTGAESALYTGEGNSSTAGGSAVETDTTEYVSDMEKRLETLLTQMDGAGRVKVLITLRASMEKIVEKDEPLTRSNTTEADAEGGSRQINNVDAGESTVFGSDGSGESPYVIKTLSPEVEGVLVLAEGAGSGSVSKNISDAIQALFNIEAHKIKVVKMKQ